MRNLVLATASVIALGFGPAGAAHADAMSNPSSEFTDWRAGYGVPANPSLAEMQLAQQLLHAQGLYNGTIYENGSVPLDATTKLAVEKYQGEHGLSATGTIDKETMLSLLEHTGFAGSSTPPGANPITSNLNRGTEPSNYADRGATGNGDPAIAGGNGPSGTPLGGGDHSIHTQPSMNETSPGMSGGAASGSSTQTAGSSNGITGSGSGSAANPR